MSVKEPDSLPIDLIGSPGFFPALLDYIRSVTNSHSLPLDEVIIKSILLCLVAGNKHLVLRTPEEDIGVVVKVVVWTLSFLFGYPTQKVKLRSYSSGISPAAFLGALFLPSNRTNASQEDVYRSARASGHYAKPGRPLSSNRSPGPDYSRSISYPNDLAQAHSHSRTTSFSRRVRKRGSESRFSGQSETEGPYPSASHLPHLHHSFTEPLPNRQGHHLEAGSLEFPRALVLSGIEKANDSVHRALVQVLSAKCVTRADLGGESVQTGDLGQRYEQPNVHGSTRDSSENVAWPLPPGFIMIYVCPIDTKERPPIHRSLLDRFAMSHNVQISQAVRYALKSTPFSPPLHSGAGGPQSNPSSPSLTIHSPLPQPHSQSYTPPYFTKPLPAGQPPALNRHFNISSSSIPPQTPAIPYPEKPIVPGWFLKLLRQYRRKTYFAPSLDLYLSDLFSAVRHHPSLDGMMLTASARKDAEALARAARVIGADLTGMELLRPPGHMTKDDEADGDDSSAYYSIPDIGASHIAPQISHSPQYSRRTQLLGDESSTTPLLRQDSASVFTNARTIGTTTHGHGQGATSEDEEPEPSSHDVEVEVLEVTEVDVARIVPRVVTHRLRLRDSPSEEVLASAVVGATFDAVTAETGAEYTGKGSMEGDAVGLGMMDHDGDWTGYGSLGIKDILVDILNKV
ncbi:hypothetical protein CC2G_009529 [Coprinopsis cinerea AmutBmut pab1-1]|nr:hypothetical protein CC2G_009529 [Coprinopsis cinerea AmutBmut pab1-1]